MSEGASTPLERIQAAQQAALQTFSSALRTLADSAKRGLQETDPTTARVLAMVDAFNSLATVSAAPLREFLEGQRRLADSMAEYARLQSEMSELLQTTASNQDAIVTALEVLLGPVVKSTVSEKPTQ